MCFQLFNILNFYFIINYYLKNKQCTFFIRKNKSKEKKKIQQKTSVLGFLINKIKPKSLINSCLKLGLSTL
jgi:hypothetical protein